jgi:anti-sigma regulatory factor (Ser/Thr protein kinase)
VLLAVGEACTNVVQHAYGAGGGSVEIDATVLDDQLALSVRDEGTWRRRGSSPELAGGRGVHVMRSVMDAVDVVAGSGGTHIRMRRNLKRTAG